MIDYSDRYPMARIYDIFGQELGRSIERLTNHVNGVQKDDSTYYEAMSDDIRASVGKGVDNIHNLASMPLVYSAEKILGKVEKARKYCLPMLKKARKNFPQQDDLFQNLKTIIQIECDTMDALITRFAIREHQGWDDPSFP